MCNPACTGQGGVCLGGVCQGAVSARGVIAANPSSLIRYGQEEWYPRRDPMTRLAALDAERIPDRKSTSHCVMTTLHLGRDDRGKENVVSPP